MNTEKVLQKEHTRREQYEIERAFIKKLSKSVPLTPRVKDPPRRGWRTDVSCRRCGYGLSDRGMASEKYCPNCGQHVKHYIYAGQLGWNEKAAEEDFRKMLKDNTRTDPGRE